MLLSLKFFHNTALVKSKGKYQHFQINNTERIPCLDTSPEETRSSQAEGERPWVNTETQEGGRAPGGQVAMNACPCDNVLAVGLKCVHIEMCDKNTGGGME